MVNIEAKVTALKAAASGKPKGSPEWIAAVAAVRELAAAKRGADTGPSAEQIADRVIKAKAAMERREQDAAKREAVLAYERAMEWPRCGEGWGEYPGEACHAAVLADAGIKTCELEVFS